MSRLLKIGFLTGGLLFSVSLLAESGNDFYTHGNAFLVVGIILLITAVLLVYFSLKRKKYFLQQLATLKRQNHKLQEQISNLEKGEEQLFVKRMRALKEEIEDMTINYKSLQNSLGQTKKDSIRNSILLSNLGHSIRTNLNGIIGFSILLENEFALNEENELFEYTQDIKQSGESLMYLLNNIIDFSQIEANTLNIKSEACDLKTMTEEIVAEYKHKADEKKLKIVYQDEGVPLFTIDNKVLKHVLVNLLDNAIQFTEKGYIKISTAFHKESKEIEWSIVDTGVGIDKAYLPDLFEPYRQHSLGYSGKSYQGIGLGLPLSKKLLEKLKGTIKVASEKAVGTTVTVTIPFKRRYKVASSGSKPIEKSQIQDAHTIPESKLNVTELTVLVVEPEKFDGMLMKKMLDNAANIFIATDGMEALQQMELLGTKSTLFDLVFIELKVNQLPDGSLLINEMKKKNPNYKTVSFVAMSSFPQLGEEEEVIAQGFNAYLPKPIVKSSLIKIVNNMFENREN